MRIVTVYRVEVEVPEDVGRHHFANPVFIAQMMAAKDGADCSGQAAYSRRIIEWAEFPDPDLAKSCGTRLEAVVAKFRKRMT